MLKRAVVSHNTATAGVGGASQQRILHNDASQAPRPNGIQPLKGNPSAVNSPRSVNPLKRKLNRTMSTASNSNLSQLHQHVIFDENDFDDDDSIDLNYCVAKTDSSLPSQDQVVYPTLPPIPIGQKTPPSSAPIQWSTSPLSHFVKPELLPPTASPDPRQSKRRVKPWERDLLEPEPAPQESERSSKYFWDKSASAVKNEHKELRRRNAAKLATVKPVPDKVRENVPATHLSEEQLAVAKAVVDDGKSVFFTGSAGTGKSVLMRSIITRLRRKYAREPDRLAITASTGLAACVIEGGTLHSWAGIGLGKEPAPELCKRIKRNAKTKTKWLRTKVLIIDEISMVDGELFDKLEQIARTIRNNGRPFGGIQLVITGDFFQLPPVPEKNSIAKFAFDAATWNTCIEHTILLTHVFRQKDPVFANMLNEMRLARLSTESIQKFQKLSRPLQFADDVEATELFPTRGEVDAANTTRMQRLMGQEFIFEANDSGVSDLNVRNKILQNFMAPEKLALKKGAQVMLIKNIDSQLVNGTLGKVIGFMDESCYATYKDDEETYHKAHDDAVGSDDEEKRAAKVRFDAARYKNKDAAPTKYWPMVRFPLADGTFRDMLCMPEEWKTENQQAEVVAKRVQVPLILAWALSIHKAQGQTLNRVKVDLGRVFEKGQAYVALSRATSQDGLQILRFDPRKVMVHHKVTGFYEKLVSIHSVLQKDGRSTSAGKPQVEEEEEEDDYNL